MTTDAAVEAPSPGDGLATGRMPGHWLLARMGKRVLRPGGLALTRRMLAALDVGQDDHVVEFAPGLGVTARLTLERRPASYVAVERDQAAARIVRGYLTGAHSRCVLGRAEETGLPDGCATVVYGEAMLSMQSPTDKLRIIGEAHRLLRPGGRYGIHELCVRPDGAPEELKRRIQTDLTQAIHHGVRPLTRPEWRELFASAGFTVRSEATAPMHLLEPRRVVQDEGLWRALCIVRNVLADREARRRVQAMRAVFRRHADHLAAITLVGVKTTEASA